MVYLFVDWSHYRGTSFGIHIQIPDVSVLIVARIRRDAENFKEPLMNLAHLHLLLNHFPIIGTIVALGLFIGSFIGKNDDFKRSALIIFAAMALITLPAFFIGIGAQRAVRKEPGVLTAVVCRP